MEGEVEANRDQHSKTDKSVGESVMINGDGFISDRGRKEAEQILAIHAPISRQLEKIIGKCRSFVLSAELKGQGTDQERQKIIVIVLAVRLLEISEAAVLIMKNGMSNEANTLFRVFLDAYFVFANVCADAAFVPGYFKSDETARLCNGSA